MKRKERKHRIALIVLVSAIVFCILLVAVVLAVLAVHFALDAGVVFDGASRAMARPLVTLMCVVSLAVGSVTTALISRESLKPVNRVINQMNRLAAGDYTARVQFGKPIGIHPTFVEVSESFNKLAQELENTEMLRSDFINNFSHEFKTPIVSIAGFAKLLRRGDLTDAQREEYLRIIEEESLRLSAMATNVLNLSKCENLTILTDVTSFNLSEQIRAGILALEGKWARKNLTFRLDFDELTIEANPELLQHVWSNLLDNAIKFSAPDSQIEVSAAQHEGTVYVSVKNVGTEIPQEQQARIFNKFYQADESHASEGSGVGLALVRSVVELHGGSVSVTSRAQTTVFTVALPQTRTR